MRDEGSSKGRASVRRQRGEGRASTVQAVSARMMASCLAVRSVSLACRAAWSGEATLAGGPGGTLVRVAAGDPPHISCRPHALHTPLNIARPQPPPADTCLLACNHAASVTSAAAAALGLLISYRTTGCKWFRL